MVMATEELLDTQTWRKAQELDTQTWQLAAVSEVLKLPNGVAVRVRELRDDESDFDSRGLLLSARLEQDQLVLTLQVTESETETVVINENRTVFIPDDETLQAFWKMLMPKGEENAKS